MAKRVSNRLTDLQVRRAAKSSKPMRVPDGGGLHLEVHASGSASWVFRYTIPKLNEDGERIGSRERWAGLGAFPAVSLADARDAAEEMRRLLRQGVDPLQHRKAEQSKGREAARLAEVSAVTFKACAKEFIESHSAAWKNEKHAAQWPSSLKRFAYPVIGETPVKDVDTELVLKVLRPIWLTVPETATRVRQRIEAVLDAAAAKGLRSGANPARWRGHLDKLLPRRSKVRAVKHHAAMPHGDLPAFWLELRTQTAMSTKAMSFTILTAARTSEVRFARSGEIDFEHKMWTVPAERMKAKVEHVVPLPDAAIEVLRSVWPKNAKPDDLIFPGTRGKAQSENTMLKYLKEDLKRSHLTVHGFRSSFRDWVGDETSFPGELAEMALAHTLENATAAAYRRKTALERRRKLMEAWAGYVTSGSADGKVVCLTRKAK